MSPIRSAILSLSLLVVAAGHAREEIAFRVAPETTLVRTLSNGYSMRLASMSFHMNGEEVPPEALGELGIEIDHSEQTVVTDLYAAVAGARPERLLRSFDELSGKEHAHYTSSEGDESHDTDYESDLEGKQVVFSWNDEDASYDKAFADGGPDTNELLATLEEDLDLRSLLPEQGVSEGDSWKVDPRVFQSILDPGGDLGLHDPESEENDTSAVDAQLRENMSGEFLATYRGTEDVDGKRVALIELHVDTHTQAESSLEEDEMPEGASGTNGVATSFRLAGELRWDLEHGHALALELAGETGLSTTQSLRADFEGESIEQVQVMTFEGSMTFTLRIERK